MVTLDAKSDVLWGGLREHHREHDLSKNTMRGGGGGGGSPFVYQKWPEGTGALVNVIFFLTSLKCGSVTCLNLDS